MGKITEKMRLCFVSLNSYSLLVNSKLEYVGGSQIQQVELAKEFIKRGYEIYFIVYTDEEDSFFELTKDGIHLIPTYERTKFKRKGPLRKFLILWKKMKEVNADIYFHRTGSPGVIAPFGLLNEKKTIYLISSDADVTGEKIIDFDKIISLLGKLGRFIDIKFADLIISQNKFQKEKLSKKFGVKSYIIRNAFNLPPKREVDKKESGTILWIGTIRFVKQPALFLQLAKSFPQEKFVMIGGKGEDSELYEQIKSSSKNIKNLDFVGFVPHDKISEYYKKSCLLVNTSKTEGFPNVFLEAWINSIPVVSLNVDPDGIISRHKLGFCSKDFNQLKKDINHLIKNESLRGRMGKNAIDYVENNHNIVKAVDKYEELFSLKFCDKS